MLWDDSGDEPENVVKRPRLTVVHDVSSFWLDVTYTKQVTQKNKRFNDGRMQMDPRTLTAKLFDFEGTFVCSGNFQTVIGFTDRWNSAVAESKEFMITKGFYSHLVFVPEPRRTLLKYSHYSLVAFVEKSFCLDAEPAGSVYCISCITLHDSHCK